MKDTITKIKVEDIQNLYSNSPLMLVQLHPVTVIFRFSLSASARRRHNNVFRYKTNTTKMTCFLWTDHLINRRDLPSLSLFSLTCFVLIPDFLVTVDQNHNEPQLQERDQHVHHYLRDHISQLAIGWETGTDNEASERSLTGAYFSYISFSSIRPACIEKKIFCNTACNNILYNWRI